MAELQPYPFGALVRRMFRELELREAIFDLPRARFMLGSGAHDFAVKIHGRPASSPLGPAAGPHSQLAQNIVLAWLGGCRVIELKTVQINDQLTIPRPCIDMQTVGYNVEWSQELRLEESLREYVKAAMLLQILVASKKLDLTPGFDQTVFDMSVGYDLAGIRSDAVMAFVHGLLDAGPLIDELRAEIPSEYKEFRDLDFTRCVADTLTLSTFHGCPPHEIERICDYLLREVGLHTVVKLNPTLLGAARVDAVLHDALGYPELRVPPGAYDKDTQWDQAVDFVGRLGDTARQLGRGFGIKLTNTLIVENHRDFFPRGEREMYLSGPPLHVLAMELVGRFRDVFGDRFPISFSAGIDRKNFADAVALGLRPITVCSDLLKPGGYARAPKYFADLGVRMDRAKAWTVRDFILRGYGHAEGALARLALPPEDQKLCLDALAAEAEIEDVVPARIYDRWVTEAVLMNTRTYTAGLLHDSRYHKDRIDKPPRKIGSQLTLFNCVTCDKCIPVCPNDANFTFVLPRIEVPIAKLSRGPGGRWQAHRAGSLVFDQKHQIGTFADFCNECGNCDVFCPEDGGPYIMKPRFFGTLDAWRRFKDRDGFFVATAGEVNIIYGRFSGRDYLLTAPVDRPVRYTGPGFSVTFDVEDPVGTCEGESEGEVDLTYFEIMNWVRRAVLDPTTVNYVNARLA